MLPLTHLLSPRGGGQQASAAGHGQDGCLGTGSLRGWGLWGQRGSRREGVEIPGKKE